MRPASGEDRWFSLARRDLCGGCHTCWWGRWKSQNRKIVLLSPYVEEPLNSKVIKSFVPEQRSRKCFSCFEIPMFYVIYVLSLWTFDVRFTHSHIMAMVQHHKRVRTPVALSRSLLNKYPRVKNERPYPPNCWLHSNPTVYFQGRFFWQ